VALIGDSERERAVAQLRRHYLGGRLSIEELTERLEVALNARRDSDVRRALTDLPAAWREQAAGARAGVQEGWRAFKHTVFVAAVWMLWWVASVVLLVGFVASVVVQGASLVIGAVFGAVWLACTFAARRVVRRRS